MKKIFIILFVLSFSFKNYAQIFQVLDEETKEPISDAMISSDNVNFVTNDSGYVKIDNSQNMLIYIFAEGYLTKYLQINLDDSTTKQIFLTKNIFDLDEITVSANRWEQRVDEIPISVVPINVRNIDFTSPQTTADLIGSNNNIFIQKSQLGGGSPMIRGMAANRILIVVDGIRMNNAIYRSGNLQNVISVDPFSIEQAEVVLGPGSVIYGSDALGGVMDFHTIKPFFATGRKKIYFKVNAITRYSSANNENTGHLDINFGLKKISFFTSYSYSKFDDLVMGTKKFDEYTRPEYVETIDNVDLVIPNSNINKQVYTGYNAQNFIQKISFQISKKLLINYGYYYSTSSDIPRYDKLIYYSGGALKYAEWFYGPQTWQMHKLTITDDSEIILWDNIKFNLAYQDYTESRNSRKFGKKDINKRTEKVRIFNINIDAFKTLGKKATLFYGFEGGHDLVNSSGLAVNVLDNSFTAISTRYPDGSTYQNYDVYSQLKIKLSDKFIYNIGARFSQIFINAIFDKIFYDFPFDEAHSKPNSFSGSTGIIYTIGENSNITFNLASGFRAPNIDDIGKVFDSEPGNVVVPNPNLDPEKIYDAEIGFHKTTNRFYISTTAFYSYLDKAMIRKDFTFNGQDSILYDGTMSKVQALLNDDFAIIYGVQINLGMQISKSLVFKTAYNYMKGKDSEGFAIRHVPPAFGSSHIIFNSKKLKADLYADYDAQILNENLAPSEQNKPQIYAKDVNGNPYCPSWWTLNAKFQYKISNFIHINAGVENIFDLRYRPYSSGIVYPGRNFILSLKISI